MNRTTQTKPSLLIVDDNADNLQVAASCLSQHIEADFYFARNGEQALETASECLPQVILLDVMMPTMNGIETCRQLKANRRTNHIPVIFLTAKIGDDTLAEVFEVGGADYIRKPFKKVELLSRVRHQLELVEAQATIALQNKELRHLLQILCHDLINPISSAVALTELCQEDPSEFPNLGEDILFALTSSKKLIDLARTTCPGSGRNDLLPMQTRSLASFLDEVHRAFRLALENKNIQWHQEVSADLMVRVEPVSFVHSVLGNLISNAIKFSPSGGSIVFRAQKEDDGMVRLEIIDQGIGIDETTKDRLFTSESPSSRTGTLGEQGTGFGLALAQKFVTSYGGRIEVKSVANPDATHQKGTIFSVFLTTGESTVS